MCSRRSWRRDYKTTTLINGSDETHLNSLIPDNIFQNIPKRVPFIFYHECPRTFTWIVITSELQKMKTRMSDDATAINSYLPLRSSAFRQSYFHTSFVVYKSLSHFHPASPLPTTLSSCQIQNPHKNQFSRSSSPRVHQTLNHSTEISTNKEIIFFRCLQR